MVSHAPAIHTSAALAFERVVMIRRATRLEELVARFNTRQQARFYLEHAGSDFAPIEVEHEHYHHVLAAIRQAVPPGVKSHIIERGFLPQYQFEEADLVVVVGPDGLVVNTAKYLGTQPMLAVNPDPAHIDGVLLAFTAKKALQALPTALAGKLSTRQVTMASARLTDGEELIGFNDLFVGASSHVSARYHICHGGLAEDHSSSGIIVSTGAGSTGWLKSVYAGAAGVVRALGGDVVAPRDGGRFAWDAEHLVYAVREPWPSKASAAGLVYGVITRDKPLVVTSQMGQGGVIFSDGIQADALAFNAGAAASITLADRKARLIVEAIPGASAGR